MTIRKPDRRLITARRSANGKRELAVQCFAADALDVLAKRIAYEPYAKHKLRPRAFGLEPVSTLAEDATFCDAHAGFAPEQMRLIPRLLRRGVRAGLLGREGAPAEPRVMWTIGDDGWVFECRITHSGRALYHGYPLLPGDAMASKVISHFEQWVYGATTEILYACDRMTRESGLAILRSAQERYRS